MESTEGNKEKNPENNPKPKKSQSNLLATGILDRSKPSKSSAVNGGLVGPRPVHHPRGCCLLDLSWLIYLVLDLSWLIYLEQHFSVGLGWCCWAATQGRGADASLSPTAATSCTFGVCRAQCCLSHRAGPCAGSWFLVFHVQRGIELP